MSQQSQPERPSMRSYSSENPERPIDVPDTGSSDVNDGIESSMKQMWEIVRKSTDVIVALREENAILRSELSALRRSERQMHDRLEEFLQRIATLEDQHAKPITGTDPNPLQIDRLEDKLVEYRADETEIGESPQGRSMGKIVPAKQVAPRNITITVTIKDEERTVGAEAVDSTVRSIVAAATTALGAL